MNKEEFLLANNANKTCKWIYSDFVFKTECKKTRSSIHKISKDFKFCPFCSKEVDINDSARSEFY